MKLTINELMLYTNDDYRENVLKSKTGKEFAQQMLDKLELNSKEVYK